MPPATRSERHNVNEPLKQSHWVRYDQPGANGRLAMAVCGQQVNPKREHAAEPTCPTCAAWLRAFAALEF
jgi:hypothetical protein